MAVSVQFIFAAPEAVFELIKTMQIILRRLAIIDLMNYYY